MWPAGTTAVVVATVQGQVAVLAPAPRWPHGRMLLQEAGSHAVGQLGLSAQPQQSPGPSVGGFDRGPWGSSVFLFLRIVT